MLQVRFVFDNGPGSIAVVYIPSDPLALCDGQWHYVRAEKNGVIGTLQVDQNAAISQSSPFTSFRAINTNDPLFIGGVPGGWSLGFVCILNCIKYVYSVCVLCPR